MLHSPWRTDPDTEWRHGPTLKFLDVNLVRFAHPPRRRLQSRPLHTFKRRLGILWSTGFSLFFLWFLRDRPGLMGADVKIFAFKGTDQARIDPQLEEVFAGAQIFFGD
jgi:hypothetical protein